MATCASMAVAELPFDLVEVKLAAPLTRPGTVAKADVIARLCAASVAVRDRGRARRIRQDDPARALGRGRSASVRVGRARRARRRRRGVPALHRGRDSPRRAAPARGVRRAVRPGGSTWAMRVPRVGQRAGRARAPAGAGARRSARRRQSVLSGRARGAVPVRPGRLADRDREQGRAGAAACPLAGAGTVHEIGVADLRLDEQEAGLLLEAAGVELDASERLRADRADGGLARRPVPRGAVDAGRGAELGERRGLHRRRPVRVRVLPPRAPVPAAGGRGAVPQVHLGAGSHVRRSLRRRARDDGVGDRRSRRSSARTASSCRSTGAASGIATTTCSASCCGTSSSGASRTSCAALNRSCDGLVHRQRPARGGGRLRARRGRDGHRRRPGRRPRAAALLRRPNGDRGGVARVVRRRRAGAVPRARRLRSLVPRADGAARRGRAVARPRRRGNLDDPALGRQRHDRALGRHPAGAHDAETVSSRRSPTPIWRWISFSPDSSWSSDRAPRSRRCARAARRDRSCDGRPHGDRRDGAGASAPSRRSTVAQAQLALLAAKQGAWGEAAQRAQAAQALVEETGLGDYSSSALAHVATARVALHEARQEDARAALTRAHRLRPLLDHGLPWLTIQVGLELTRAHLALGEAGAARTDPRRDRAGARAPPGHGLARRGRAGAARRAWRRPPGRPAPGR